MWMLLELAKYVRVRHPPIYGLSISGEISFASSLKILQYRPSVARHQGAAPSTTLATKVEKISDRKFAYRHISFIPIGPQLARDGGRRPLSVIIGTWTAAIFVSASNSALYLKCGASSKYHLDSQGVLMSDHRQPSIIAHSISCVR